MAKPVTPLTPVFLYIRTSTDEQDDSPAIQEERARAFCAAKGWEVVGEPYYEIGSGKLPLNRRPKFAQMLRDAPIHGVWGFVGLTFNRFLRSAEVKAEMEKLLKQQGLFISGLDDKLCMGALPNGERQRAGEKAMLNMTVAMDQYYADFVGDKIVDHHRHRVSLGLHHSGSPPFGYKVQEGLFQIDGRYYDGWAPDDTPDGSPDGLTLAERFRWAVDRFIETENMTSVAAELTNLGVPTPRLVQWNRLSVSEQGRRLAIQAKNKAAGHQTRALPPSPFWDSSVLSDMLRSKTYLGLIAYTPSHQRTGKGKKEQQWHEGLFEPLLTQEKFEQVQAILEVKGRHQRQPARKLPDALLNGMLFCTCGRALTYMRKGKRSPNAYRYVCNMRKKTRGQACQFPTTNGAAIEQAAFQLLSRGLRLRVNELRAALPLAAGTDAGQVAEELAGLFKKRDRILESYEDGLYGEGAEAKSKRDSKLAPILKRAEELQEQLAPRESEEPNALEDALDYIERYWPRFSTPAKRDLLRAYAPEGFAFQEERVLRAEVCGALLEVPVAVRAPPGPGERYGGRQRKSETAKGPLGQTERPFLDGPFSGGTHRSGGMGQQQDTRWWFEPRLLP